MTGWRRKHMIEGVSRLVSRTSTGSRQALAVTGVSGKSEEQFINKGRLPATTLKVLLGGLNGAALPELEAAKGSGATPVTEELEERDGAARIPRHVQAFGPADGVTRIISCCVQQTDDRR